MEEGYADDPDLWISDLLATATRSPQGYVLRFAGLRRAQAKELTSESVADADLFSALGGGTNEDDETRRQGSKHKGTRLEDVPASYLLTRE